MPNSHQSWKRRRLNPPAEAPTSSTQKPQTSSVRNEADLYDDIEGAHDNPSIHQNRQYLVNDHAIECSGGEEISIDQSRKVSSRKRISGRTSEKSGRLVSESQLQEPERIQPTSSKLRKRNVVIARATISTDEDELGNEVMSEPDQQLLLETGLIQ